MTDFKQAGRKKSWLNDELQIIIYISASWNGKVSTTEDWQYKPLNKNRLWE